MDIQILTEAFSFGLAMGLMFLGLVLTFVPIFPGVIFVWFVASMYAVATKFEVISPWLLLLLTLIALTTASSDIWLPLVGAKRGGASRRSLGWGGIGTTVGFVVGSVVPILGSVIGSVAGYVLGIFYAEYHEHEDWGRAMKASTGGFLGWLLATAVQLGGGLLIMFLVAGQVLWWGA